MKRIILTLLAISLLSASCCNQKKTAQTTTTQAATSNIIVKLKSEVKPDTLVTEFQKQKLKIEKVVVPSMNMWLISFDNAVSNDKMLKLLKASPNVEEAELDKEVELRQ